ncbi:MAG: IspD/TarI family cytidylyltransferase [Streptosporangiales bacterium]
MYSLILLNGGLGARVSARQPKQFLKVNGLPILVYSIVAADAVTQITEIVLNYPEDWRDQVERIVSDYAISTPIHYVPGAQTRHESVAAMLKHCTNDNVIIHESARPLVRTDDFERLVAEPHDNVAYMLPLSFTVAPVDPETRTVTGSLRRDRLRNVQLPQKFARQSLVDAHEYARREGLRFTEDATLVAASGGDVRYLDGADRNFKVTTRTDVRLAGFMLHGEVEDWDE